MLDRERDPSLGQCLLTSHLTGRLTRGDAACVRAVAGAGGLDVYAHNVETVERLQGRVRDHRAGYRQVI